MSKMDNAKVCECLINFLPEDEPSGDSELLDEIDEDELVEDTPVSHKIIWEEIEAEFNAQRKEIEDYRASKVIDCVVPSNPAVQFLEDHVFPILKGVLIQTLTKAKELDCVKHQKSTFNGLDYIAENLWNLNDHYLERKEKWTCIFDMDWVIRWLENNPRPYFPLSWVWNRDYGATKIQAYMRGYWVRCRADVQEMRQFWKV
ncbi:hypothetical protein RI129_008381 [Pyrocoelia pectoralis]|uniref:Uncharacterized protein n=1 Tax=Pyrocoelia pectoralis TaxID=417401 RepID=A0AAN7VF54_9COLE